jgi:cell division protein FtsI (penicillin-binding protein 3)
MKPFFVAAGLASGRFNDQSIIDTNPGYVKVGAKLLEDPHNLGAINLATCLALSSNVCLTKVALALEPAQMYGTLTSLGFGQVTTSGYPGESAGLLPHYSHWRPVGISSMSRGYGLSITPLQLAHAYATVGALGVSRPISFLRVETPPAGDPALDPGVSRMMIQLLEAVVAPDGGGKRAAIPGYTVAGKTGTAWKATAGGYATDRYLAVFAGVAPASAPRLAAVVIIDEPGAGKFYGGEVAAPVFSGVVGGALRLLAVPPDAPVGESGPGLGVTRTVATR